MTHLNSELKLQWWLPSQDTISNTLLKKQLKNQIYASDVFERTSWNKCEIEEQIEKAQGFVVLYQNVNSLPCYLAIFSFLLSDENAEPLSKLDFYDENTRAITFNFAFSLISRFNAIDTMFKKLLNDPMLLNHSHLQKLFLVSPNRDNMNWYRKCTETNRFIHTKNIESDTKHWPNWQMFYVNRICFNSVPVRAASPKTFEPIIAADNKTLSEEQSVASATANFIRSSNQNAICCQFLKFLEDEQILTKMQIDHEISVTVRLAVLSHHEMPAAEGWHCDYPFFDINDNITNCRIKGRHFLCVSALPPTLFLKEKFAEFAAVKTWRQFEQINTFYDRLQNTDPGAFASFPPGTVVEFGNDSVHKATTYISNDPNTRDRHFRLFIRVSHFEGGNFPQGASPQNKIMKTVQVYTTRSGNGM